MAKQFSAIDKQHRAFIEKQQVFFVATAAAGSRVNLSPKGGDCLRVVEPNRVVWLNLTGSGNETAAHLPLDPRMTLMFCSYEKTPLILRLYGQARVAHRRDEEWQTWIGLFAEQLGARQLVVMEVEMVQTSCGYGVPLFDFVEQRPTLERWAEKKGAGGIREFWDESNRQSLDGLPTHILPAGE